MTCPYCSHQFPMTWMRYVLSPGSKHTCPSCRQTSKFRRTAKYFFLSGIWSISGGILGTALYLLFFDNHERWLAGWFLGALAVSFSCDRFYENHYRELDKLEGPEQNNASPPRQATHIAIDDTNRTTPEPFKKAPTQPPAPHDGNIDTPRDSRLRDLAILAFIFALVMGVLMLIRAIGEHVPR